VVASYTSAVVSYAWYLRDYRATSRLSSKNSMGERGGIGRPRGAWEGGKKKGDSTIQNKKERGRISGSGARGRVLKKCNQLRNESIRSHLALARIFARKKGSKPGGRRKRKNHNKKQSRVREKKKNRSPSGDLH